MLLNVNQFGGIQPKIKDPLLLADGKSQVALNCRFDNGGVEPITTDLLNSTPTHAGTIKSIFFYQFVGKFLAWLTDVSAITAPLANDAYHRIFYTEGGKLKVTDSTKYAVGGTDYPETWLYPSPPAPVSPTAVPVWDDAVFNPILAISMTAAGLKVSLPTGAATALSRLNTETLIALSGTGSSILDGNTFKYVSPAELGPYSSIYLPDCKVLDSKNVTAITNANPGVATCVGHGLYSGDLILFTVTGIALTSVFVTVISADTFSVGIDTTALGTFSGGTWALMVRDYDPTLFTPVYPLVSISSGAGDAISKANPAKVTHTAHGLTNNMVVQFTIMVGMIQLEGIKAQITVSDANTFFLNGIDSTAYGVFTSGKYQVQPTYLRVADPLFLKTTYYVETLVNSYGSEGPPSPASVLIDILDGDPVTVGDSNTTFDALYGIVSKNIYRSNTDASGTTILQFLDNIPVATVTYADTKTASQLGELLTSTLWDAPVDGVEGLIALANETIAAFSGNLVLCSEPLYPHAWPYQFPTDTPVMGLGAFGTSILVLTQGIPYLITGNSPVNYIMDKLGTGVGCVSKQSVVQVGGAVLYAGTDGLIAMSTNSSSNLTEKLISPKQWRETYAPTSIRGYFWEGKYIGFYDTGTVQGGFSYDPEAGTYVTLDFHASAGYHDSVTGCLYLVVGANIVEFARGETLRTMALKTKRYRFNLTSFRSVKIVAASYPATVNITYYGVDADELPTTNTVALTATSGNYFSHPDVGMVDECDITITSGLTAIYLAGALNEFPI